MKICTVCKEEKELLNFPKSGGNTYQSKCKICFNKYLRSRYDPEKEKKRKLRKKLEDPEKIKQWNKKANEKRIKENPEKHKAYHREYRKKQIGKDKKYNSRSLCQSVVKWIKKNPEKHKASYTLRNAVKSGKVKKSKVCQMCAKESKVEGHHYDYNYPLNVIWCCRMCHKTLDRARKLFEKSFLLEKE